MKLSVESVKAADGAAVSDSDSMSGTGMSVFETSFGFSDEQRFHTSNLSPDDSLARSS